LLSAPGGAAVVETGARTGFSTIVSLIKCYDFRN
jgi:hypothetical protein